MSGPLGGVPPAEQLMTIARDDRDRYVVLAVHGEVDLGTGGRLMEAAGEALQQATGRPVILDLSAVDFLSSSGLGQLVALHEEARASGVALRIVVGQARAVIRPLTTMGLNEVLSLYGTVDEAAAG
jgi:anti-sigma B factor antagonist